MTKQIVQSTPTPTNHPPELIRIYIRVAKRVTRGAAASAFSCTISTGRCYLFIQEYAVMSWTRGGLNWLNRL